MSRRPTTVALLLLLLLYAVLAGCNRDSANPAQTPPEIPLVDSLGERTRLAEELIRYYPRDEFGKDLSQAIDKLVGAQVLEEARSRFKACVSVDSIDRERIESFVEDFSAEELKALGDLLKTPQGKEAFRKLPAHWRKWGDRVMPVVYEALTNAGTKE